MADKWMDERDYEPRDWRRTERVGRDGLRRYSEPRSFDDDGYEGDGGYEGGRDAVFGETGNYTRYGTPNPYRGERAARSGWQSPDYGGVSPAMRRGGYGGRPRFQTQDYRRDDGGAYGGGRFYGDDSRERIYREEYGEGDVSPTRARYHALGYGRPGFDDEEFRRDMRGPASGGPYSGGTGGYDYERGYGDGGRGEARSERTERFERAGRNAGDFLHRAGERVANWFAGGSEARAYDPDFDRPAARGLGPKGYRRSDERINDDAHERLTDDPWLDASMVIISVSAGEVTLSGSVSSREAKHRAERLVEDISGVTHVQNNLRLKRGGLLTGDATGYGDVAAEAQMRADEPTANGSGGAGGGQSTAGRKN